MKVGKLSPEDLSRIIKNNRGANRSDVRVKSGIGEDCSVIEYGEYDCVLSTDPITGAETDVGKLAVHINCNDIASCGVEIVGILVTILAPPSASLEEIENVMKEIHEEALKLNVEILGGHTEVTNAVNKLIVSCTAIGKGKLGSAVSTSGAKVGDEIVVTKKLAMEGTSIVVNDYFKYVKDVLTDEEVTEAKNYIRHISVAAEGQIAGRFGVNSMHDITEGGVLGALWEMALASGVGFEVFKENMPVSEVTQKICKRLGLDVLKFISSGSMLITTNNGEELVKKLAAEGIEGSIIGNITKGKGILVENGQHYEIMPPERDELFTIEEKVEKLCI